LTKSKKVIETKCKKIKLVLTDVDGVLTDGGRYFSEKGEALKKFHTRDGMGIAMLRKKNISTIIVTKEKNDIIKQWAKKMPIAKLHDGVQDKKSILNTICKNYSVISEQVAYIGDDINDVELLKVVGLSACPFDGADQAKDVCDYICSKSGGNAAFRELAELILANQKP